MNHILSTQLSTLHTDYLDFYLLHSLTKASWEKMKNLGALGFLDLAKKDGKRKHAGFSFHGDPTTFKEIIDAYDWDFCQIQYNYLDEHNQAGTEGLEYAAGKKSAVMVMEPLRGGNLAVNVPDEVKKIWDESPVNRSPAEWALRWVWNHPEVTLVLSGMNNELHIDENLRVAGEAFPNSLSQPELILVARVRDTYQRLMKVHCTGCGYCIPWGAFTGAISQRRGRFERADKGTIFLDEIGELPPQAQVRLLNVLQRKEIERVGGSSPIPVDTRVISATNRNLEVMIASGRFREDLWFRLNVFPIMIPPTKTAKSERLAPPARLIASR